MFKGFLKYEKFKSKIKLTNNSSFVILIFAILKFRNIGRSKIWPPPIIFNLSEILIKLKKKKIWENFWGILKNIFTRGIKRHVSVTSIIILEKERERERGREGERERFPLPTIRLYFGYCQPQYRSSRRPKVFSPCLIVQFSCIFTRHEIPSCWEKLRGSYPAPET